MYAIWILCPNLLLLDMTLIGIFIVHSMSHRLMNVGPYRFFLISVALVNIFHVLVLHITLAFLCLIYTLMRIRRISFILSWIIFSLFHSDLGLKLHFKRWLLLDDIFICRRCSWLCLLCIRWETWCHPLKAMLAVLGWARIRVVDLALAPVSSGQGGSPARIIA